jgi:3-dehydroquinate synthase
MTQVVRVNTAAPYDVTIGSDLTQSIADSLPNTATKVLLVHSEVLAARAGALKAGIEGTGRTVISAVVPDAEAGKTASVASFCWQVLGKTDFTRSDVVVGVGGGAVTDLAGFVAATWLRGVAVVQVPTSLNGMVDAAIGGKTGINTEEGKNLVGAFHEPAAVWCDLDALLTLPQNQLVAGLAEVVKGGFIRDTEILDIAEANLESLAGGATEDNLDVLAELVRRKAQVKADVVAADLKESFEREILNYGHTFGHAIEYTERYQWRHGAAVSVGMMYAAELAHLVGKLAEEDVDRHRRILDGLGLPTTYPEGRWDALMTAMRRDKKSRGETLRFVILQGIGTPVRLEGPDPALLTAAYDEISYP